MAALEQVPRRCFKIYEWESTELLSSRDETLHTEHVLDGTVELLLTDLRNRACRKKDKSTAPMTGSRSWRSKRQLSL